MNRKQRPHPFRSFAAQRLIGAAIALGALVVASSASIALASGEEHTTNGDDLTIRCDTRWAGGGSGGYLPIRLSVSNLGPARQLSFEFEPAGSGRAVSARKDILIDQNATVHFTLSIPLVESHDGSLRVYAGGRHLENHRRSISVPGPVYQSPSPPAMLVIAPGAIDCARFVDAANHLASSSTRGRFGGTSTVDASLLAEVVQPTLLPESWIDYSGLDFVAISREELERLERPVRQAVLKWVQCGGNLLVYETGKDASALTRLDHLLEAPEPAGTSLWLAAIPSNRPSGEIKVESDEETTFSFSGVPPARLKRPKPSKSSGNSKSSSETKPAESAWHVGADTFRHRDLLLGSVIAFPGNPFPGTVNDWTWFCQSGGHDRWSWTSRHGTSPRIGTSDFFKFMNAGIHGVPTIAFLILISAFSIVIGPVNYVYLSRKKMLWLLLFTVPALAVTTSVVLVGYSMAIHGFAVRSRIRSLTLLDQRSRTAVTAARLALFAGVSPSGGLRFSPETAVIPVIPTTNEPVGGSIDWTQTQNLQSGWLPARTRTQFYTVRNSEQRARAELRSAAGKSPEFWNGLPWELEMLVVSDDAGHFFVARNVPAGATVALAEGSTDDLNAFVQLLKRNEPMLPVGFVEPTPTYRTRMRFGWGTQPSTDFGSNFMERRIADWRAELPHKKGLAPRSYVAVLRDNPGVETGVTSTSDQMSLHLLNGYF